MSDGHSDGCGIAGHPICAEPVAGNAEAAYEMPAPAAGKQVIKGVEINLAPVREIAKERRIDA